MTLYNEDPDRARSFEWRELWYCEGEKSGTFTLMEAHGWWDVEKKKPLGKAIRSLARYESESDADEAMGERIQSLRNKGWIYKKTGQNLFLAQE